MGENLHTKTNKIHFMGAYIHTYTDTHVYKTQAKQRKLHNDEHAHS